MSKDGDLPRGWAVARLADLCSKLTDGTHHSPANGPVGDYLYITAKNIRPWGLDLSNVTYVTEEVHNEIFARCPPEFEDVLYIKDGVTTGLAVVNHLREPFSLLSSVALLKPIRMALTPRFLKHWLNSPNTFKAVTGQMTGTAIRRVVLRQLRAVEATVAPLNEQRRIVAKIEALQTHSNAAKEALDAIPPLLQKFRQSVLAAAFRGDLTRDWRAQNPDVEPASVLLERIRKERKSRFIEDAAEKARAKAEAKALAKGLPWTDADNTKVLEGERFKAEKKYKAPDPVDTTGLPELPKSWCWASFDDTGELLLGRRRAPEYATLAITRRYLRVANVKFDRVQLDDVLEMQWEPKDVEKYALRVDDILLSEGQSLELIGQSAMVPLEAEGMLFQSTLHRLRTDPGVVSSRYAQLVCMAWLVGGIFRRFATITTNIAHLSARSLKTIPFPLCPAGEQAEVARVATNAMDSTRRTRRQLAMLGSNCSSLNQSILAKAFRGELVPQDPNDESASVLLERIRSERENAGSTKKGKPRRSKRGSNA